MTVFAFYFYHPWPHIFTAVGKQWIYTIQNTRYFHEKIHSFVFDRRNLLLFFRTYMAKANTFFHVFCRRSLFSCNRPCLLSKNEKKQLTAKMCSRLRHYYCNWIFYRNGCKPRASFESMGLFQRKHEYQRTGLSAIFFVLVYFNHTCLRRLQTVWKKQSRITIYVLL